jgi:aminoglycoside phosphotransferase (APT) family kinase protein
MVPGIGMSGSARRRALETLNANGWRVRVLRPITADGLTLHPAFRATTESGNHLFVKMRSGAGGLTVQQYTALARSGVPMPEIVGQYDSGVGEVCEVYRFLEGQNAQKLWPDLSPVHRLLVARHLAVFAAALHDFGRMNAPPGIARRNIVRSIHERANRLRDALGSKHPLWRILEILPRSTPRARLCHGDLNAKNAVITSAGAIVLVDWEWTAMAEPAYEFKNVRAAAARGYRELTQVYDAYRALTGARISERRLLLADIDYALIQLEIARQRHLLDWVRFHTKRLAKLVRDYQERS